MPLRFFAISQKIFEMSERCNNSVCFSVENKSCADISVTFVVYAYSNPIGNICLYNGEKKKTVTGQIASCAYATFLSNGGFEIHFKAAVLHAPMRMTTLC